MSNKYFDAGQLYLFTCNNRREGIWSVMKKKVLTIVMLIFLIISGIDGVVYIMINVPMDLMGSVDIIGTVCTLPLMALCALAITIGFIGFYDMLKEHFKR
jgi:hypothetical protein